MTFREHKALSTRELIRHINDEHHAYLRTCLPHLEKMSRPYPMVYELIDKLAEDLHGHMHLEEEYIFNPVLRENPRRLDRTSILAIHEAHGDHSGAARMADEAAFAAWSVDPELAFCLRELSQDLFNHILEEEAILFPRLLSNA